MPFNHLDQFGRVSPNQLVNPAAVLEHDKRGHGADAQLAGQVAQLVDVKLDKVDRLAEGRLIG